MKRARYPKPKTPLTVVAQATVASRTEHRRSIARAEREVIRRHQIELREIERWEVAREIRPHIPQLTNDVLRRDDVADLPPVMQTIYDQAGPCPDIARPEPPVFAPPETETREVAAIALSALGLLASVLAAIWLAGRVA